MHLLAAFQQQQQQLQWHLFNCGTCLEMKAHRHNSGGRLPFFLFYLLLLFVPRREKMDQNRESIEVASLDTLEVYYVYRDVALI